MHDLPSHARHWNTVGTHPWRTTEFCGVRTRRLLSAKSLFSLQN
jgi:hypothetical protein